MLFGTPVFVLAFLPAVLLGFHLLSGRSAGWALAFLLAASFVFYGWDRPADLPLLAGSILVNFAIGLQIGRGESIWLVIGIWANLTLLALCKYAGLLGPLLGLRETVGPPPLGISFFT